MAKFIPWSSQPLKEWAGKHAPGKSIDLDGLSTHYLEKGEGEPLILIHGFFYDSYMWDRNLDALAERFKVYAMDLWGFGYSTREPLDYGYALYADQLLKFMNALDIGEACLVGQSMGAGTCIAFCVDHRDRVNKMVLVDAGGLPNPLPPMGKFSILPRVGEFMVGLRSDFYRKMVLRTTMIYDKNLITADYFENVTRAHKVEGSNEVMLKVLRRQFFGELSDEIHRLGEMDVPVLLVWGRQDKGVPLRCGQEMHRILKGSRLEVLERAGHCPHFEHAQEFNEMALDFLVGSG